MTQLFAQFLDGLGEEADTSSSETSADGTMLTVTEGCNVRAEANSDSEIIGGLDEGIRFRKWDRKVTGSRLNMMVRPDMYTVDCFSKIFRQNKRHGMDPVSFFNAYFFREPSACSS